MDANSMGPARGGTRGGKDQFDWEAVKAGGQLRNWNAD
jgi:hypothetical protein